MKLVTYIFEGKPRLGALHHEAQVVDLTGADDDPALASMQALIDAGPRGLDRAREYLAAPAEAPLPLDCVRLLPPLPRPVRLRDCSLFLEHMEKALQRWAQTLAEKSDDPATALASLMATGKYDLKPIFRDKVLYYNADALAVSGPEDDIVWPSDSDWMDYELEWACVVGRTNTDIAAHDARDHIFGFTIFNDWSARDVQLPIMEGNLGPGAGKDFPGGYGLGPCIVTPDEIADPYALTMTARVNGEEWSRGSTASMHHTFEDAIVDLSRNRRLVAGEVIGSGTVLTGCGFELGRRLQPDDRVELEIEGIGTLANRVRRRV